MPVARRYALILNGYKKNECTSLDELRHVLASTSDMPASQLPPTEDSFRQHVLRAMYQTAVWCHSHQNSAFLW